MKRAVTILVALGLAWACSKTKPLKQKDPVQPDAPQILKHIPSDSPFVMVSPEPMPRAFTDWIGQAIGPAMEIVQQKMTELRAETDDPVGRAILAEFDGKLNREGFEGLGFTLEPRFALYAIGTSLAIRVEVADGAKVAALFDRLEQNSGQSMPQANHSGVSYRQWIEDDVAIVVAVIGNELVAGVMHQNAKNLVLPVLFGKNAPEQSFADTAVFNKYRDKYKLLNYSFGYIDSMSIVRMITGKASALTQEIMAASEVELPEFSAPCQVEFTQLAQTVPRLVFGYQDLNTDLMRALLAVELRPDLANDLAGLQTPVLDLAALSEGKPMFAFGMNADVGKMITWAKGKVAEMASSPYRCEFFDDINDAVAEMQREMDSPVPPFISGLKGAAVSVSDFQMSGFMPTGSGYLTMAMDDVMGTLDVLKGEIPQLGMINIAADGKPVSVPIGMPGLDSVDLVATQTRFSMAAGAGMIDKASSFANAQVAADAPAMVFAYDYVRLMQAVQAGGGGMDEDEAIIMDSLAGLLGFTTAEIRFTGNGIIMNQMIEPGHR